VAFNWNVDIVTLYGSWNINGTYSGSGTMDITEWQPGIKGQVAIGVNTPIHHSLKVIHGQLELELGDMTLNQGSATLNWKREQPNSNGYFNITSGVPGSLTLCKLTYSDPQNPVEFSIDNIQIQPVKLNVSWQKLSDIKWLHISKNQGTQTTNLGLIKLKWADKTLTIGNIGLKPGKFNITCDSKNKTITLKNSMNNLGPLCTIEDENKTISVDLFNLVSDYSKKMTLEWYNDSNNKITGLYLDTDGVQLVDFITFTSIRKNQDPTQITGRRIALGGFEADNFKIKKNTTSGKLEINGSLHIANHITYSRLVNYTTDQWERLNITFQNENNLRTIKFENEFDDLTIKLLSFEIGDIAFNSEINFDYADYLEIKCKLLIVNQTEYREFHFDTNNVTIGDINFSFMFGELGLKVVSPGIRAEDFYIKWNLWPPNPNEDPIQKGGFIEYEEAALYYTLNGGNNWNQCWPPGGGSQPQ
jgi:hypothetical protein